MSTRESLWQLQELDEHITRWTAQQQRNGLSAYQQRLNKLTDCLQGKRNRLAQLHTDLKQRQQSLLRLDQELAELRGLSGYEASVLRNRLETMQQHKAEEEEVCLQTMLELEELEPQIHPLELEAQEVEAELAEAQSDEQERKDGLEQRLLEAAQQRARLAEKLGPALLEAYRQAGLEEVKSTRCPRCRLELPDHLQRQLRQGEGLACPNCQVVLVKKT